MRHYDNVKTTRNDNDRDHLAPVFCSQQLHFSDVINTCASSFRPEVREKLKIDPLGFSDIVTEKRFNLVDCFARCSIVL